MDTQKDQEDADYEEALQRAESEGWHCQGCDEVTLPDDEGDYNLTGKNKKQSCQTSSEAKGKYGR